MKKNKELVLPAEKNAHRGVVFFAFVTRLLKNGRHLKNGQYLKNGLYRFGGLVAFFLLWQIVTTSGVFDASLIPSLGSIWRATWQAFSQGSLTGDVLISLHRSLLAFLTAVVVAVPLGLLMGSFPKMEAIVDPLLQVFRQTSALALYPVFILLMGMGETSKVFVIFWAAVFPILLSTISGVQQVDRRFIEMAHLFGANSLQVFYRVLLPASVPAIFVGLRLSATTSLLMLVAAEMIGAHQGLGVRLINAQYNFQVPLMFGVIFLLAMLGLMINTILVKVENYLCQWSDGPVK